MAEYRIGEKYPLPKKAFQRITKILPNETEFDDVTIAAPFDNLREFRILLGQKFDCPECGAKAGMPCVSMTKDSKKHELESVHKARWKLQYAEFSRKKGKAAY